ncbi:MAG: hypothetical protein HYV07_30625 [Deltaproteobacteria bacterium]|nr:hypothetical protein [Deltaproteobacteria bacterium]
MLTLILLLHASEAAADVPEFCFTYNDKDHDGFVYGTTGIVCPRDDCDDDDPSVHPGATEVCADDIDQDCDGHDAPCPGVDDDSDGHHAMSAGGDDCDDHNPAVHPGAPEIACDGLDNDCAEGDATCSADEDLDGYRAAPGGTDCNDHHPGIHPHAAELCGDGVDQDCADGDAACENDADQDGHRNTARGGDDCDDFDASAHPGAAERCGDGRDQDCDGQDLMCAAPNPDADGDGHPRVDAGGDDCDDTQAGVHPGASELCGDQVDQDCDGRDLSCSAQSGDGDGDSYLSPEAGGSDCNDQDAAIYPGAEEICGDQRDQDCDGADASPDSSACGTRATDERFAQGRGRLLTPEPAEATYSCSTTSASSWSSLAALGLLLRRRRACGRS